MNRSFYGLWLGLFVCFVLIGMKQPFSSAEPKALAPATPKQILDEWTLPLMVHPKAREKDSTLKGPMARRMVATPLSFLTAWKFYADKLRIEDQDGRLEKAFQEHTGYGLQYSSGSRVMCTTSLRDDVQEATFFINEPNYVLTVAISKGKSDEELTLVFYVYLKSAVGKTTDLE